MFNFLCVINFFQNTVPNTVIYTVYEGSLNINFHKVHHDLHSRNVIKWDIGHFRNKPFNTNWSAPFIPVLSWTYYSDTRFSPILYLPLMYLPFCIMNVRQNWSNLFCRQGLNWRRVLTKCRREFLEPPGQNYEKNWDTKRKTSYRSRDINIRPCNIAWWKAKKENRNLVSK